jgi:ketose-bisphosphate aldolase
VEPARALKSACDAHVLVPAFNVAYLPMMEPIADAVEELRILAMAEVALPDVKRFGAKSFAAVAERYFALSNRSLLSLHLDHVPAIDEEGRRVDWRSLIREGLELGFQSVMIDGSRLPLEENIGATREVVEMAHRRGVPVEGELGAVLGHEAGPLPPYEELFRTGRGFTRPEDAARFVRETGVDWLSVATGNIHGAIVGAAKDMPKLQARLNIEHLEKLSQATRIPLVLHGGSGISSEHLREAVGHGITKINVGTEIRQAYEKALARTNDTAAAQEAVREAIRKLVREDYRIEGSAAKIEA